VVSGSITKASQRISLSQPSISQHLTKLEKLLGTQLIHRNRTGEVSLTAAGDYWYKKADDILRRLDGAIIEHQSRFTGNSVALRMGTLPTLRGRFAGTAARIALDEIGFVKLDLIWATTSSEIFDLLRLHQINCAILNSVAIANERSAYRVSDIFEDKIVWLVPRSVPMSEIALALNNPDYDGRQYPALSRYVEVGPHVPMHGQIDSWYRHSLPAASPVFSCSAYVGAVDFVAEGLATSHCPLSLLPNLPVATLEQVQVFTIDDLSRTISLVMPRHLLTLPSYARIFSRLEAFASEEYNREMLGDRVRPLPVPA
jgi:DNA-binding transcriptional LysR family regulator